jgi:hypothetical protein
MSDPEFGCYLYGVIAVDNHPSLEDLRGVAPAHGVRLLDHGPLRAVVSWVPLAEFGGEALKSNLEDLAWLERTARTHAAVLEHLQASGTVVPVRLCAIFDDESGVRTLLDQEQESFLEALECLCGHAEWSVKVVLSTPEDLRSAARQSSVAAQESAQGESVGRAYLSRKVLDRALRDEGRAMVEAAMDEIHARLRQEAEAGVPLPAQGRDLSGRAGEMVLNAAYLVETSRVSAFQTTARELGERYQELGLDLDVAGPWPPYNFVIPQRASS